MSTKGKPFLRLGPSRSGPPEPAWELVYTSFGGNLVQDITGVVMEVNWIDRLSEQVPEVSFKVEDSQGLWQASPPQPEDTLQLSIGYRGATLFDCGTYSVDESELIGPPDTVTVRGIRALTSASLRTRNSFSYEGMTLTQIAQAVAARHGFTANTDAVSPDVQYDRRTQCMEEDEDDLSFLRERADEHGYVLQIRPPQIIFYSRSKLEAADTVATLTRKGLTRFRFVQQTQAERAYGAAQFTYFDPNTKQLLSAQAKVVGAAPTANTLNMTGRVENNQQAAVRAVAGLQAANMHIFQGELEMPGTIVYRCGQTIQINDFGKYAGKYIIEQAEHTLSATRGYRTKLTVRTAPPESELVPYGATGGI